ncbi:MAG: hypothetical protein M1484_00145 [Patescibacteria group bacterium]|nr:hypothetical protein [Patescibacteria group bacterium]MCL5431491.1 hypothetical protein [Patescibacteria group bacterium]
MWRWGTIGLLGLLFFLFLFPQKIFAAVTISNVSPATINSPDDIITIPVSITGISSGSAQYLQVAITKDGAPSNYLGFTKNSSGDWIRYQTTPDLPTLYSFTPNGSSWNAEIQAKFDIDDSGYTGPGIYNLFVWKYISSPTSHQNSNAASISATMNLPSDQSDDTTEEQTTPDPEISWDTVDNGIIGDIFKLTFSIKNFDQNVDYFIKMLGGQTQSAGEYLSSNDGWTKFPKITADGSGCASGEIYGRIKPENDPGDYQIGLRFHHSQTGDNTDSNNKTVGFIAPAPAPTVTTVTTATINPPVVTAKTKTATKEPEINLVLGTTSARPASSGASQSAKALTKNNNLSLVIMVLFGLGMILTSGAILVLHHKEGIIAP